MTVENSERLMTLAELSEMLGVPVSTHLRLALPW